MKFPADCVTARDRAEYALLCKVKLIERHNAEADPAVRYRILKNIDLVSHWAARYRKACGLMAGRDESKFDVIDAFKAAAAKSKRWKPDLESIDYYQDRAATKG